MKDKPVLELGNLRGPEGNAFVILGRAQKVAKENGMDWDAIRIDAMSKNYEHLLEVISKHFKLENTRLL